jgi:hypothetical protein
VDAPLLFSFCLVLRKSWYFGALHQGAGAFNPDRDLSLVFPMLQFVNKAQVRIAAGGAFIADNDTTPAYFHDAVTPHVFPLPCRGC